MRRRSPDPWHWLRTPAAREPAALFCDFDGTLVPFVYRPDGIVVPHGVISLLLSLQQTLDHAIAIVSGRPLAQLDRWLHPFSGVAAGLHGAEIRSSNETLVRRIPNARVPDSLRHCVQVAMQQLSPEGRPFIEDKGLALALHYSSPITGDEATASLQPCLIGHDDWQLGTGRRVVEVRHRFANKGHAVAELLQSPRFAARRVICLGDDITDLDMFDAVRDNGGISIAVGPRLRRHGDFSLAAPSGVRVWLQHFDRVQRCH